MAAKPKLVNQSASASSSPRTENEGYGERRPTSEIHPEDADGCRKIYIYLYSGDSLSFQEAKGAQGSTVDVEVDEHGARDWTVRLAPGDMLETGRIEPPPDD